MTNRTLESERIASQKAELALRLVFFFVAAKFLSCSS